MTTVFSLKNIAANKSAQFCMLESYYQNIRLTKYHFKSDIIQITVGVEITPNVW